MTECPPRCGACCDPVILGWDPAGIPDTSPNAEFIRAHWTLRATGHETSDPDDPPVTWQMTCDAFDTHTRRCTAYTDRPPICRGFPWYGGAPLPSMNIPAVCAYHDDVPGRRVLPLTVLTPEHTP